MATKDYFERSVLVEGEISDISNVKFKSYFENKIKSGGGEIKNIERKTKELEIEFKEKNDALGVIKKRNHHIGGKVFLASQLEPKKFYRNIFSISNLPDNFEEDDLTNFLEAHSKTALENINYTEDRDMAVLEFSEEIDFDSTKDRMAGKKFLGRNIKIKQVVHSKVIKVSGLAKETPDEDIKLHFANKRRRGNGKVSKIDRSNDSFLLVHFEDSDAPLRVTQEQNQKIVGQDVSIEIYHDCLNVQSKLEGPTDNLPNPIDITEDMISQDKIQMLRENSDLFRALNTALSINLALISKTDPGKMTIECTVTKCTKQTKQQLQSWEKDAKTSVQKFFEDSCYQEVIPIEKELEANVREWLETKCKDQQHMYRFQGDDKLIIEGLKDAAKTLADKVKQMINEQRQIIETQRKEIRETIPLDEDVKIYLKNSGLLEKFSATFPDNTFNIIENGIEINGTDKNIKLSMEEIGKSISSLKKHGCSKLSTHQKKIIGEPCNKEVLCKELSSQNLSCGLVYQNQLTILHETGVVPARIEEALSQLVPEKKVDIPPEKRFFLASSTFKKDVEKIMDSFPTGALFAIDEEDYSITVTAMHDIIDEVVGKIKTYVENLKLITERLDFKTETCKKFFNEKGLEMINNMEKKFGVVCRWEGEDDDIELLASTLEADKNNIADAQKYIEEISSSQIETSIYFKGPGVDNLFNMEFRDKISQNAVSEIKTFNLNTVQEFTVDKEFVINGTGVKVKIGNGIPTFLHSDIVLLPVSKKWKSILSKTKITFSEGLKKSLKGKVDGEIVKAENVGDYFSKMLVYGIYPVQGDGKTEICNILDEFLKMTEDCSSIAIPIFEMKSHEELSRIIREKTYEVVQNYFVNVNPASLIQTVWFYGDKKETEFIKNAEKVNKENSKAITRRYRAKGNSNNTVVTGRPRLLLVTSDIIHEETQVLVNSTNEKLNLNQGNISSALLQKCGNKLQEDCKKKYPKGIKMGQVAFTDSFNIVNTRRIYHVCLPRYTEDQELNTLTSSVIKCLHQASKEKLQNIAFPPIGCGILQYPREKVAEKLFQTVYQFGKDNPDTSLSDVTFVMYHKDEKVIEAFEAQEKAYKDQYKIINRNVKILEEEENTDENLALGIYSKVSAASMTVYAATVRDLNKFTQECTKHISDSIKIREERSTELKNYDDDQLEGLMAEIRAKDLQVEVIVDRKNGTCKIKGCQDQLTEICQVFKQYCTKMKALEIDAANLQKRYQWYYTEITETEEKLLAYDFLNNHKMEMAFSSNKVSATIKDDDCTEFVIDFLDMTEYKLNNGQKEKPGVVVVRKNQIQESTDQPPEGWGNVGLNFHVEPLDPNSNTYKQVQKKFQDSLGAGSTIVKIEEIQNVPMYKRYRGMKKKIETDNNSNANEKELFHGTNYETTKKINREGFNRSYSDPAKSALGMGVYFATESAYSARDDYAKKDKDGCKYMYLADVLVGKYVKGKKCVDGSNDPVRQLPPLDQQSSIFYNSAVDKMDNPRTYAIFNDNQAYPRYLICFRDA